MLPYIISLIVLAFTSKNSRAPKAEGIPTTRVSDNRIDCLCFKSVFPHCGKTLFLCFFRQRSDLRNDLTWILHGLSFVLTYSRYTDNVKRGKYQIQIKEEDKHEKKTLALILTLALSLAALTGCGSKTETPADTNTDSSAQTETPAEAALSGSVSTNGSTSMEKVIGALSEQFMADNSGVTVTYDPTGSGAGIEAASNGSADIGLASRALKDEEKAGGLTETVVALDGIAVIVNADSKVENLTVEQIGKIFTGEITDWSEVGGDAGTISCIGREAGSGTRDGFESITGTKDACKLDQELTSTGGVIEAVAGNPNAIGYASLSAVEGKNTVKAVTVGGVACTEETVLNGSYAIQRPFVLVTKTGETLSPAAQAFFDYATSSAASQLIKAAGAVPVAK